MNKVLISLVGKTDPTREDHDGPILHIIRNYQPTEVYLLYSKSFYLEKSRRDNVKKHINHLASHLKYEISIYEYLIDSEFEVNNYDIIKSLNDLLNEITNEIPKNKQIIINVTSGTPQMTSGLLIYSKFNIGFERLTLLQVNNLTEKANISIPKQDFEPLNNYDYYQNKKRVKEVTFDFFFSAINKNVFIDLINKFQYQRAYDLLKMINFKNAEIFKKLSLINDYTKIEKEVVTNHFNATKFSAEDYRFIRYFNLINIAYEVEDYQGLFIMSSVLLFELTYYNIKHSQEIKKDENAVFVRINEIWEKATQFNLNKLAEEILHDNKYNLIKDLYEDIRERRNNYAHNFIVEMDLNRNELRSILNKLKYLLNTTIDNVEEKDYVILKIKNQEIIKLFNNS